MIAYELWEFEIFNLTSEVKFDLGGQSSFWSKVAHLTKEFCSKNFVLISMIAYELWEVEIFNLASEVKFDLGGQSSFWSKVAHFTSKLTCKIWSRFEKSYKLCSPCN